MNLDLHQASQRRSSGVTSLGKGKVLVLIVSYNAERFIRGVLDRIPSRYWNEEVAQVLLMDDGSPDQTLQVARDYGSENPDRKMVVYQNPKNLGYGGNQKLGYQYAIDHGFVVVILLHGDGQYPPELLDLLATPILSGKADLVLASRMLNKLGALKGGMPLYKFIGNIALTAAQNFLLRRQLSEYHTGYRAYRVEALARLPIQFNSDGFDFDSDILIQCHDCGLRFTEIPIPTFYGEETSHVKVIQYGLKVLAATLDSRFQKAGLRYRAKFDYKGERIQEPYPFKPGRSSHAYGLAQIEQGQRVLELGGGNGMVARMLEGKGCEVTVIDKVIPPNHLVASRNWIEADLDSEQSLATVKTKAFDVVLLLDVIEHLHDPEAFLSRLREQFGDSRTRLVLSTPNVAFWMMRLNLLFGRFEYTPRGILDRSHVRLFTFRSLLRLLEERGFEVTEVTGIGAPIEAILGEGWAVRVISFFQCLLIRIFPSFFAYQIGVTAKARPSTRHLLDAMERGDD